MNTNTYELKTEKYCGPLHTLLLLIEERKMEITEISMAEVTDDFLRFLEEIKLKGDADMRVIADFVVVASKLVFIKSKALLPEITLSEDEEREIKDLEERLRIYKELRPGIKIISSMWKEGRTEFSRPFFMNISGWIGGNPSVFYPGANVSAENLKDRLEHLFEGLKVFAHESEIIRERIMTLEEKIGEIVNIIKGLEKASFKKLSETKNIAEIIITFLAILHLAREQRISLEQEEDFSDIIIRKN